MKIRSVKFNDDLAMRCIDFTTSCKRESTAISRFTKVLSDYDFIYTELMLSAFMNLKPSGTTFSSIIYSGSKFADIDRHAIVTYCNGVYRLSFYYVCEKPVEKNSDTSEDTTDTSEDTTDTSEDTTDTSEDTTDTSEDTTDTSEDTTDTSEDTNKYTVALGFLDDVSVPCLSFKWCHAPFDTVKECYNCAFNQSCDTAVKYSYTTDNFQILPAWVYSQYNINPVLTVALTHLYNAFVGKFGEKITPYSAFSSDTDEIIIIDDTFSTEELPF